MAKCNQFTPLLFKGLTSWLFCKDVFV